MTDENGLLPTPVNSAPAAEEEEFSRTNLIVNYVPPLMSEKELEALFSSQGKVESCRLIRDKKTKVSLNYAFVNYFDPVDAEQAVKNLNKLKIQGKILKVCYARPSCEEIKFSNLFIHGIPKHYSVQDLEALFSPYGRIIDSKLIDRKTNDYDGLMNPVDGCWSLGFVRFYSHDEAKRAIEHLDGATPHGSNFPLIVKFARCPSNRKMEMTESRFTPPPPVPPAAAWPIFVFNLCPDIQDIHLWRLFGPFGAVQTVSVVRDMRTNRCKGYAIVSMTQFGDAARAIQCLNGFVLEGRVLKVSFKTEKKHNPYILVKKGQYTVTTAQISM